MPILHWVSDGREGVAPGPGGHASWTGSVTKHSSLPGSQGQSDGREGWRAAVGLRGVQGRPSGDIAGSMPAWKGGRGRAKRPGFRCTTQRGCNTGSGAGCRAGRLRLHWPTEGRGRSLSRPCPCSLLQGTEAGGPPGSVPTLAGGQHVQSKKRAGLLVLRGPAVKPSCSVGQGTVRGASQELSRYPDI